jgi:hypothetical protein
VEEIKEEEDWKHVHFVYILHIAKIKIYVSNKGGLEKMNS